MLSKSNLNSMGFDSRLLGLQQEKKPEARKEDAQTIQQRQAAAKLALRKQLEKTLLQVRGEEWFVKLYKWRRHYFWTRVNKVLQKVIG